MTGPTKTATTSSGSGTPADGVFIIGGRVMEFGHPAELNAARQHLASLLQVHNLVVLLGSGASFHLGSPLIRGLSTSAITTLVTDVGDEVDDAELTLLKLLNRDDEADLEVLLDQLQTIEAYGHKLAQPQVQLAGTDVATDTAQALHTKLNRGLANACKLPSPGFAPGDPFLAHRTLLSRLARSRRSNLPRTKIFTTNYDLAIERALDQLGYPYIDGFSGTVDRRLNLAHYGIDHHRVDTTSQRIIERADSSFFLHKLHGSLNWRLDPSSGPAPASAGADSLEVRQVADTDRAGGRVLIYPTAAKEADTLAYPYADLLRLLSATLQQPDTAVLSLGYGYWDAHINRILLGALTMNAGMHLSIADPTAVYADLTRTVPAARSETRVADLGPLKDTPIARLAATSDSRITVLTGACGQFVNLVDLLPDPGLPLLAPNDMASIVASLVGGHTAGKTDAAATPA